jgi:thioesterase domain-containing protein/acyl carrier protein
MVSNTSTAPKIELLTQLWCRVLQLTAVGPDDNFFDLGGDSALAVQLFAEIAEACGQQLPPVMIYHVPTIASQAALLEHPAKPEFSPLVLLKPGPEDSAVFIAPGLGGGPAEFLQLAKFMHAPHSIYGLQPKGIEGFDEPSAQIGDMAEFYARAIAQFQPHGPYILAGYSLGGLVALEMARRFVASGEKISLLILLDSYPHICSLSRGRRLRLLVQRARVRIANFQRPPRTDLRLGGLGSAEEISTFAPAFGRVRESAYLALRRYRPTFYSGAVKFIRAAEVSEFPEDPKAVWSRFVEKLEVETVPGDHLGMLTTHYEILASVLDRYLRNADDRPSVPSATGEKQVRCTPKTLMD